MRFFGGVTFGVAVAFCADTQFYGGVHAETAVTVARFVVRGILAGLA